MAELTPFALKDTPALIEAVFPAQKVSFEAQKERKANLGQTLTGLGSYWKGRKPLILVRSVVLGSLLPQTGNTKKDLEIFELLMAFDDESLAKRALIQNSVKPKDIAERVSLHNPWDYFAHNIKVDHERCNEVDGLTFPMSPDSLGLKIRWRRDIGENDKIKLLISYFALINGYEEKSLLCKRPEEVEQEWLYKHIWSKVNEHYREFGVNANSHEELIEQLGILKYGHRPRVADTFCGGGSIPFEAARLGCDVYAADLNPVACMLTWSASNIIGASKKNKEVIAELQAECAENIESEILKLEIEADKKGNRAKGYLYCLETVCPQTGWTVPLSTSWVISKRRNIFAKLTPNASTKKFDIEVVTNASSVEMKRATKGTVRDGNLVYSLNGRDYTTPIKTIRQDYKDNRGNTKNRLRHWEVDEFTPQESDIFTERLYAVHWITASSFGSDKENTYFSSVTEEDLARERKVIEYIKRNIISWQESSLLPNMHIENGYNTDQPIRERGWRYWHQLFNPRQLLIHVIAKKYLSSPYLVPGFFNALNWNARLSVWDKDWEKAQNVFMTQSLNTLVSYGMRSSYFDRSARFPGYNYKALPSNSFEIRNLEASNVNTINDLYVTDPPYADAVNYHEITEFFIAWLRKNPPKPFDEWTWDSKRALAIKGAGDDFRKGMVRAYRAMADHMPDNGMQCVMFTHQDTGVWSDMIGIFWAAGLQVVGAWYIATETTSELKKGGYVQGTVILMLRKRTAGENAGFKQRLLPAVRAEVKNQIETMMHLNDEVKDNMSEPVFNDSDLQMAGYAAALKVLTSYTHIGGEDVTTFALRPRNKGDVTVVDEIVQQAAEAANSLLVPDGLSTETWQKLSGIQRFYLRMMDIETTGASKKDNYDNFAKAFHVQNYSRIMGNLAANSARLKRIPEFASRDLGESSEIGSTWLGHLIIGLQQLLTETEPQAVISQLQADLPDFMEVRALLVDMLKFIENKAPEKETRDVAEILGARLKNMRALGN